VLAALLEAAASVRRGDGAATWALDSLRLANNIALPLRCAPLPPSLTAQSAPFTSLLLGFAAGRCCYSSGLDDRTANGDLACGDSPNRYKLFSERRGTAALPVHTSARLRQGGFVGWCIHLFSVAAPIICGSVKGLPWPCWHVLLWADCMISLVLSSFTFNGVWW